MDSSDCVRDLKGKSKLVKEEDQEPPRPNSFTVVVIRGAKRDNGGAVKSRFRFRAKELNQVLGSRMERINDIYFGSGATIRIYHDTPQPKIGIMYLELEGNVDQVDHAQTLITNAITQTYKEPFIPMALMPTTIPLRRLVIIIPVDHVRPMMGCHVEIEATSNTWIQVITLCRDETILEAKVEILGEASDVTKAQIMIQDRLRGDLQ